MDKGDEAAIGAALGGIGVVTEREDAPLKAGAPGGGWWGSKHWVDVSRAMLPKDRGALLALLAACGMMTWHAPPEALSHPGPPAHSSPSAGQACIWHV